MIKPIHAARIPLPVIMGVHPTTYMGFVYPTVVFCGGMMVMNWAIEQSHKNIGERGEKLRRYADMREMRHAKEQTERQNAILQKILDKAAEK